GITVEEPGEAVFPIKMVGDLFKKAPGEEFYISVDDGKVKLTAGRSKYKFSTYPVREFPTLPTSSEAKTFCSISAGDFLKVLEEGTLAASTGEEFPLYLSSANFQITNGFLNIVSTDTRRLALSCIAVEEQEEAATSLLPMKGVKEVQRIMAALNPETKVKILYDEAQFYFVAENIEFSVRRVESRFPPYEKILPKGQTTVVKMDRGELISALERVDVIVRDYNRMVVLEIKEGETLIMRGKAPDFGLAMEEVTSEITGDFLKIAVNSKFFMEALKVLREPEVVLAFNGTSGHMTVKKVGEESFLCLIAPINLSKEEQNMETIESVDK
ncbi:MAG: DNA polymerase III subunit beta, partial [Synergistaceae bacterium]|nr:DNA polymerase III subunit beta [Synergistaceae bacterium]